MSIFAQKPCVNPFKKMSIFQLFEILFSIAQKGVFSFKIIVKDIFFAYITCRIKVGKIAIFSHKPRVNPFGKMAIFDFLNFLFLQPRKAFFLFWNIVKDIFLPNNSLKKKKLEKWPFLDQRHGLTPFEKMSISRLFELVVFIAQNGVFLLLEYRKRHFPGLYYLEKKSWKNRHFWTQTMGLKKCQWV